MVRLREDMIVEQHEPSREQDRRRERRPNDARQVDAVGPHRGDLVVLREASEGRQGGNENRARNREGKHPAHRQGEQLQDDRGRDSLADGQIHQVEHEVQREQEDDDAETY